MAALIRRASVTLNILKALEGKPSLAGVSKAQANALAVMVKRFKGNMSEEEETELNDLVSRIPWASDDHSSHIYVALTERDSPSGHPTARRAQQNYEAFDEYFTETTWEIFNGPHSSLVKREALIVSLLKIGLRLPSETTYRYMNAFHLMLSERDVSCIGSVARNIALKHLKKEFRRVVLKAAVPDEYCLELPASPDAFAARYATMYAASFEDELPIHSKIERSELTCCAYSFRARGEGAPSTQIMMHPGAVPMMQPMMQPGAANLLQPGAANMLSPQAMQLFQFQQMQLMQQMQAMNAGDAGIPLTFFDRSSLAGRAGFLHGGLNGAGGRMQLDDGARRDSANRGHCGADREEADERRGNRDNSRGESEVPGESGSSEQTAPEAATPKRKGVEAERETPEKAAKRASPGAILETMMLERKKDGKKGKALADSAGVHDVAAEGAKKKGLKKKKTKRKKRFVPTPLSDGCAIAKGKKEEKKETKIEDMEEKKRGRKRRRRLRIRRKRRRRSRRASILQQRCSFSLDRHVGCSQQRKRSL